MDEIKLKSVKELEGMRFFIPEYQRGYRWEKQQVEDLLDDIKDFCDKQVKKEEEFYCLQPLVVKEKSNNEYEVIDGQQRLTTIFIILKCLGKELYGLSYATRVNSKTFLENIDKGTIETAKENIDFFYMLNAYEKVSDWFSEKDNDFKKSFSDVLLYQVKFIWYEPVEDDPVKVFTRLNVGKISLTNAELVKALFLNRSNLENVGGNLIQRQKEIAAAWDEIEYALQDEEFWLFLRDNRKYDNPTRIDFIFDIIYANNELEINEDEYEKIKSGDRDRYRTFRYFYEYFKKEENKRAIESWKKIQHIFDIFKEWNNDIKLYNYVGYLRLKFKDNKNVSLATLLEEYENKDKKLFLQYVIDEIKKRIINCIDLDKRYDDKTKRLCLPLLVLHNIQTEIKQNKKFPFHLYKKEDWDIEHIDSKTPNAGDTKSEQDLWLLNNKDLVDKTVQEKINDFIKDETRRDFDEMKALFPISSESLPEIEKDQIKNFALLDSGTNRGYKNAMFASKRNTILKMIENEDSSFVPVCTKKVFEKSYNTVLGNGNYWEKSDAESYKKDIYDKLHELFEVESKEFNSTEDKNNE